MGTRPLLQPGPLIEAIRYIHTYIFFLSSSSVRAHSCSSQLYNQMDTEGVTERAIKIGRGVTILTQRALQQ